MSFVRCDRRQREREGDAARAHILPAMLLMGAEGETTRSSIPVSGGMDARWCSALSLEEWMLDGVSLTSGPRLVFPPPRKMGTNGIWWWVLHKPGWLLGQMTALS